MDTIIVHLLRAAQMHAFPPWLEIRADSDSQDVAVELQLWGHHGRVLTVIPQSLYMCIPQFWESPTGFQHYIYCRDNGLIPEDCHCHSTARSLDELGHMRHLHQLGFYRAVFIAQDDIGFGFSVVHFVNNQPELEQPAETLRPCTPWPTRQTQRCHQPFFDLKSMAQSSCDQRLKLDLTPLDLGIFFHGQTSELCTVIDDIDLPEVTQRALADCEKLSKWDRLLIYTDGSSQGSMRRKPNAWVDECGTPDTWAFVVLAEEYLPDGNSKTQLVGWMTQPVLYDQQAQH